MLSVDAPAKVNLALHVTGRRPDGYHLIDSLVVFADYGDRITVELAEADSLHLEGPEAGSLANEQADDNLVVKARDALRLAARADGVAAGPVRITLDKRLPVASGIGGGSADAAATLKALSQLWGYAPSPEVLAPLALRLGADVPMCLDGRPLVATGIGESLTPVDLGFGLDLVIVNPRVGVSTPTVFKALQSRDNPPLPAMGAFANRAALIAWLEQTRNDLETPARASVPEIGACLEALKGAGALFSRMSGSGASCFGIYADATAAHDAAGALRQVQPGWFVAAACAPLSVSS